MTSVDSLRVVSPMVSSSHSSQLSVDGLELGGGLESTLPHMSAAPMAPVVPLSVGDEQVLHDPADGRVRDTPEPGEVIAHEAVAVELEGPFRLEFEQCGQERRVIAVVAEDRGAVIATVDDVVDEAFADGSKRSGHCTRV